MKLQSKNYKVLHKQKLRKKIYIYLPLTCFLFRNSLTTIHSRTIISSSSGMSCKSSVSKIAAEFSLSGKNSFCIVIIFGCQKKIFEKDGIHRVKAVSMNIKKNV